MAGDFLITSGLATIILVWRTEAIFDTKHMDIVHLIVVIISPEINDGGLSPCSQPESLDLIPQHTRYQTGLGFSPEDSEQKSFG